MGTATSRLFLVAWLCSLAGYGWAWTHWRDGLSPEGDQTALVVLGVVMVVAPWMAGPGLLPLLRRRASGGVNLPYAEYWFTGERRSASLDRLRPYLEVMGTMMSAFLTGILMIFIGERVDQALWSVSALLFLTVVVMFLGASVMWVRAVMRAFPAPEPSTRGASSPLRPSRTARVDRPQRRRGLRR